MASISTHPRRRPQKGTDSQVPPTLERSSMTLRKSGTFSARSNISSELCSPFENASFMPRRSPTNPKALEDLVVKDDASITARKDKVTKLLKKYDVLEGKSKLKINTELMNEEQILPVPRFMIDQAITSDSMDIDDNKAIKLEQEDEEEDHHHDSDSGIGSSVSSPILDQTTRASLKSNISSTHKAITKSFSSQGSAVSRNAHLLSDEAVRHIQKNIVKPILKESSLKDFHPLIEDIPRRIGAKLISNLRDLEKTLFFLAPDFAPSPLSFLKFCEASIRCLHTTVDLVCERDQRLPTDRPYTNNYFLDLVEQIRRYAEIMARTREKEAKGEELDEMDYTRDEEIIIQGGLSNNGKPAELVRKKNGKTISIVPESSRAAQEQAMSSKRVLTDDELDDDDVLRSMARRRKSDKAGDVMQLCNVCRKEFKRPCDLTKHEKTHSRPWKCTDPKCRYHDLGWPTEKERDRHINDKHSSAPRMYKCQFPPCTYSSKRESNCKQHMEKAHNWEYVRSKSNGRKKSSSVDASGSSHSPATPLTPFIPTPSSANQTMSTPDSGLAVSPWMASEPGFNFADPRLTPAPSLVGFYGNDVGRRESITTLGTISSGYSPDQPQMSLFGNLSPNDQPDFNSPAFATEPNLDLGFSETAIQQPTPALSTGQDFGNFDSLNFGNTNFDTANVFQHFSPTGQGDLTLLSPHMGLDVDEGFGEGMNFDQDFTLYEPTTSGNGNVPTDPTSSNWISEADHMNTVNGHFDPFNLSTDGFANQFFPQ